MELRRQTLLAAVIFLCCSLSLLSQTETEPNDNFASADLLTEGVSTTGSVAPTDVDDYFLGVPSDDGTVTLTVQYTNTSGSALADLIVYFYNKNQVQLQVQTISNVPINGTGAVNLVVPCRLADTVYFRVRSLFDFSYTISFTTASSGVNDTEPNNVFADASFVSFNDTVNGRIGYASSTADANDYFKTLLPDDGTLHLYLDANNTSGSTFSDISFYLYSANGTQLGVKTITNAALGVNPTSSMTFYCRAADTVYLRVNANACFTYKLSLELEVPPFEDVEPNNTLGEANFLPFGDTARGRIGHTASTSDVDDYYKTYLPDDGTLTVYLKLNNISGSTASDVFYQVYNANGTNQITKSLSNLALGPLAEDSVVLHCRAQDTMYFRVNGNGCFSYELTYKVKVPEYEDTEPNNSLGQASFLAYGDTARGRVGHFSLATDADDYYKTYLPDDGTLIVYLKLNNISGSTASDVFYQVFSANGTNQITRNLSNQPLGPGAEDSIVLYCRAQDTMYFRVNGNGCFTYELTYELKVPEYEDTEPNNNLGQARFLAYGDTARGRVGHFSLVTDADDYYKTYLPDDGTLTVYLKLNNISGSTASDVFYQVFSANGTNLITRNLSNQPLGPGAEDSIVLYCRAQDTMYFRVNGNGCFTYELTYELKVPEYEDTEPNNNLGQAIFLAYGDTARGRIGHFSLVTDADDYYQTYLPDDGTLTVYLKLNNISGSNASDVFYQVFSANGTNLITRNLNNQPLGPGAEDSIVLYCRAQDTMYFRVNGNGCFTYELTYEINEPPGEDIEPNNTLLQAQLVAINDTIDGRIGHTSTVSDVDDYFKFYQPTNGTLNIYFSPNNTSNTTASDISILVYNSAGGFLLNRLYSNQALGVSPWDTVMLPCRAADTVFVRVNASGCFSYLFSTEMTEVGSNDQEPNNLLTQAQGISLTDSSHGNIGHLSTSFDADDYYKVYNSGYKEITWLLNYDNTSQTATTDLTIYAYAANGSLISFQSLLNRPVGPGVDSLVFTCLPLDTFYLRINANGCFNYFNSFKLVSGTFYADADGDGFGDLDSSTYSCLGTPPGFVPNNDDCDDTDSSINPLATEVCDGVDNNCDGQIDEGIFINDSIGLAICQGDSILIRGIYRRLAGTYVDSVVVNQACDSVFTVTLTVNPSDTVQLNSVTNDSTMAGVFDTTFVNRFGCDSLVITTVTYQPPPCTPLDSTFISAVTCDSNQAGTTIQVLNGSDGCDSIVTTTTAYDPGSLQLLADVSVCAGDSAMIFGSWQYQPGTYYDSLLNRNGCDSVFELTLIINPNYLDQDTVVICQGDSAQLFGQWQTQAGLYTDSNQTLLGCDSIVTRLLVVNPSDTVYQNAVTNDSTLAGIYDTLYTNRFGCDSLVITTLIYLPGPCATLDSTFLNAVICDSNQAGTVVQTFTGSDGCDSVVTTITAYDPGSLSILASLSICAGDSAQIFGQWQSGAGTFYDSLLNQNGCDSVLQQSLLVNPSDTVMVQQVTNDSTQAGIFDTTYVNRFGCDSLVITTVIYQPGPCATLDSTFIHSVTCDSTQAGTGILILSGSDGCDSVVTTTTVYDPGSFTVLASLSICDGDSVQIFGQWQSQSGIYYDSLLNQNGCDSIRAQSLQVNPSYFMEDTITICQGDSALIFGQWQSQAGGYLNFSTTAAGCDSLNLLTLQVDTTANCQLQDSLSCVSDSSWLESTVVGPSDRRGRWTGVSSLPSAATYTMFATIGQPYPWGGLKLVEGADPIIALSEVRYFKKSFSLSDPSGYNARIQMYMDDGCEIYLNGHLLAREENMDFRNGKTAPHDLAISSSGVVSNAYAGHDAFDVVPASIDLDTVLQSGSNELVVVMRNPAGGTNIGGFSFRMELNRLQIPVIPVKQLLEIEEDDWAVYPNPTLGYLSVQLQYSYQERWLELFDLRGKLLERHRIDVGEVYRELDLSALPDGAYLLQLLDGEQYLRQTIIKE